MRKSAVKRAHAVLRNSGAGYPARIGVTPLTDITANKIVHPSMFILRADLGLSYRQLSCQALHLDGISGRNWVCRGSLELNAPPQFRRC